MPFPRNPFFTGREDVLRKLHETLTTGQSAALTQAISGLGGIGKTQTAVEYAYRHQNEYRAVLWAGAADETTLREGYVALARLLGLPQAQEADQSLAVQAVKAWLEGNDGWLLILDNADDPALTKPFLPPQRTGHILMTTRASAIGGLAQSVRLDKLSEDDGALLLLRRARLIAEDAALDAAEADDQEAALALSREVDGLPLALDQAGAFIEGTQNSPARYLELYKAEAAALLAEYGTEERDHASVHVTFSLAAAKVAAANPAAGELVRCCAFLAPDAIPEEIFTEADASLNRDFANVPKPKWNWLGFVKKEKQSQSGPFGKNGLAWEEIVRDACRYSLVSRDGNGQTLSIHRLVQTVVQDEMNADQRRNYASRLISAVNKAFPLIDFQNWPLCDRLLVHARACADLISIYGLESEVVARLLNQTGYYLSERAQYAEALPMYQRALAIREKTLGLEHPDTAASLNNLAGLYESIADYTQALPLYRRALAIWEKSLGPEHPDTATSINNLAALYSAQGDYAQALPLYRQALDIKEKVLGPEHPDTAASLNNLAGLYESIADYTQALPLYRRALAIWEKSLGPEHPQTTTSLNNLAGLYRSQGDYAQALPLYQQALAIREKSLGPEHPQTATSLNNLALLYYAQGGFAQALPLYQRALAIREETLGPEHPNTANSLNNLAALYYAQGDYAQALPLYQRALAIWEKTLGPEHPQTATSLNNLAELYRSQGDYAQALPLYKRALAIYEKALGPEHPNTKTVKENYLICQELQKTTRAGTDRRRWRQRR